jgi:response regulator NasT
MKTVLIVEDESVIAMDLADQLRAFGYQVLGLARSHLRAEELAERHTPDLAIIDLSIDLLSGIAAKLKQRGTKILFVTGHSDGELSIGADDRLLTKPWSGRELAEAVRNMFEECPSAAGYSAA